MPGRQERHHPCARAAAPCALARSRRPRPSCRRRARSSSRTRRDWTLIGTPQKRLDTADKVTGKPIYGIDVRVPNMLYAAILQCPVFGGTPQIIRRGEDPRQQRRSPGGCAAGRRRRRRRQLVAGEDGARCAAGDLGRGAERARFRAPASPSSCAPGSPRRRRRSSARRAMSMRRSPRPQSGSRPNMPRRSSATRRWSRRTARRT